MAWEQLGSMVTAVISFVDDLDLPPWVKILAVPGILFVIFVLPFWAKKYFRATQRKRNNSHEITKRTQHQLQKATDTTKNKTLSQQRNPAEQGKNKGTRLRTQKKDGPGHNIKMKNSILAYSPVGSHHGKVGNITMTVGDKKDTKDKKGKKAKININDVKKDN